MVLVFLTYLLERTPFLLIRERQDLNPPHHVSKQAPRQMALGQHLGLRRLQAGGQRRSPIPSLLGTDQPERRIL